jgi:hypothetical protein
MFRSQWSLCVSIVGIVTGLGAGRSGVRILVGARNLFLFAKSTEMFWGQPSLLFSAHRGGFPGVTLAAHLNVMSRKNGWTFTSVPPTRPHAVAITNLPYLVFFRFLLFFFNFCCTVLTFIIYFCGVLSPFAVPF